MDEHTVSNLTRRASLYGLAILPETNRYEYTDPRNEAAVERRWHPICEQHGAAILGTRDVPTERVRVAVDGLTWELGPLGSAERAIPSTVFHRWRALEAAGVPFLYWLWGDEQPEQPHFRPLADREPWQFRSSNDWPTRRRDPIVIGVIPTAPSRGLWVLLGRWFH